MFMKKFSPSWLSYLLIMIQLKNEKKFSHEMKYFNCCSKNKTQKKKKSVKQRQIRLSCVKCVSLYNNLTDRPGGFLVPLCSINWSNSSLHGKGSY